MSITSSLLCPIDFSPSSRGALHYALAIARRVEAPLTVLAVDDALLTHIADTRMGEGWARANTERQLRTFVAAATAGVEPAAVTYAVATGKPAAAILTVARKIGTELIVMGTHGRSGLRKRVFGATAERVLRDTTFPVLLATADPGPLSPDDLSRIANPMLVPVDFSSATAMQIRAAGLIASALHLRVLIGHVIEPIDLPVPEQIDSSEIMSERHRRACQGLQLIAIGGAMPVAPEVLISAGQPGDEIAQWASTHQVGLLVMALHADAHGGPGMGSVTYRAIARCGVLTLALPPAALTSSWRRWLPPAP
jgi:nucleotide-binding universal stress UspA family protein